MIFREIIKLSRILHRNFNEKIKETGLGSGQIFILMAIAENPGINQDILCRIMEIDKSTAAKGIKILLNGKYIIRVRDKNDMRNWIIFPSKKGEAIYGIVKDYTEKYEKEIVAGLGMEELKILSDIFDKIAKNALM